MYIIYIYMHMHMHSCSGVSRTARTGTAGSSVKMHALSKGGFEEFNPCAAAAVRVSQTRFHPWHKVHR